MSKKSFPPLEYDIILLKTDIRVQVTCHITMVSQRYPRNVTCTGVTRSYARTARASWKGDLHLRERPFGNLCCFYRRLFILNLNCKSRAEDTDNKEWKILDQLT